jgi:hypothetical protein
MLKYKEGCLTGGEFVIDGKFGNESCVMTNSTEWQVFFTKQESILIDFLINKIDKKDTTYIHVCPYFAAIEGELAIYALQNILKKNWFDLDEFIRFKALAESPKAPPIGNRDSYQGYLNDSILSNEIELKKMKNAWRDEMSNLKAK